MHGAFGHSLAAPPVSSSKYSWIGYALLVCHWCGWFMIPAHVDERRTAGCQPASWTTGVMGGGGNLCGPHTNVTTLTQARCHLPHILLNKRRLRELTINTVTSFLGPPASCSKYIHIQYIFFSVVTSSPSITPVILAHFSHVCRKSPGCVLSFSPLSYFITLHFI